MNLKRFIRIFQSWDPLLRVHLPSSGHQAPLRCPILDFALGQWEIFRIQLMEVRKRTICLAIWIVGIFPYIGLTQALYMVGTSNQSVPEMAIWFIFLPTILNVPSTTIPTCWPSLSGGGIGFHLAHFVPMDPCGGGAGHRHWAQSVTVVPWELWRYFSNRRYG